MEKNVRRLTDFQRKCEFALAKVLKNRNLSLINRRLGGERETYIYGEVEKLEIWIYENGAEIGGKNIDKRFESDDFKSHDALIDAFKAEVETLIT